MLGLIEQNPAAARSFCRHLHAHISAGSVSKLIVMLIKLVQLAITNADTAAATTSVSAKSSKRSKPKSKKGSKTAVQAKGRGTKRSKAPVSDDSSSDSDSDADTTAITAASAADTDDDVVVMTATDTVLMDNLLSLVATLWESIAHTLQRPDQLHCVELLEQHITSDTLAALLSAFRTAPAPRAAVLRIAGIVGSDVVPPQLLEELVSELLALPGTASVSAYGPVVGLLCAWGEQGHLVAAIVDSLDSAFNGSSATTTASATVADESELEHDSDAENVQAQARSRGKGKAKRGSRKTQIATAVVPAAVATVLPPRLALSMLSYLLSAGAVSEAATATAATSTASEKASAAAMTAARDALVSDARAMRRLTSALQGAHKLANARLVHTSNSSCSSTALSDELVLLGVLSLGKVLLHSEAAAAVTDSEDSDDDESGASLPTTATVSSVIDMLQWVSDALLPALTNTNSSNSSSSERSGNSAASSFAQAVTTVVLSLAAECVALTWRLSDVSKYVSAWAAALLATLPPLHTAAIVVKGTTTDDESDNDDSDSEDQASSTTTTAAAVAVAARSTVKQLLPALCRLQYKLIGAEGDGASPCAELWTLLLRFADTGVQTHSDAAMCEDSDDDSTATSTSTTSTGGLLAVQGAPVACVQKLISQTLFTYSRREDEGASLVEHTLLPAVCAAVSVQHVQQPKSKGKSNKRKAAAAAAVEAAVAAAAVTPAAVTLADVRRLRLGATELVLPRYASAVLLALLKSAGGARALLTAALHYKHSASSSKETAALCCVHLLQAIVQHAPTKVSAAAAVEVHTELSKRALVRREAAQRRRALMRTSTDSSSSSVVDSESEDSVTLTDMSTVVQRLAAAEQCLYDQLEASRQAAIAVKPTAVTAKTTTAK
jgi:trimeric autotransporter adhesin